MQNNNSVHEKSTGTQKHDNTHVKPIECVKILIKIH